MQMKKARVLLIGPHLWGLDGQISRTSTLTGPKHLTIRSDNTTAIVYINNMGGTISDNCNNLAKDIWKKFVFKLNIFLKVKIT